MPCIDGFNNVLSIHHVLKIHHVVNDFNMFLKNKRNWKIDFL